MSFLLNLYLLWTDRYSVFKEEAMDFYYLEDHWEEEAHDILEEAPEIYYLNVIHFFGFVQAF